MRTTDGFHPCDHAPITIRDTERQAATLLRSIVLDDGMRPPATPASPEGVSLSRSSSAATVVLEDHPNSFPAEQCLLNHGTTALLDPTGTHAASCPSTWRARTAAHNIIVRILRDFANEAGAVSVTMEPATHALLNNALTAAECRTLMPKAQTQANISRANRLTEALRVCNSLSGEDPALPAAMSTLREILAETPDDTKGVRLDLEILFSDNQLAWVDVALPHPTAASYLSASVTWVRKLEDDITVQSRGARASNHSNCEPSPAVVQAIKAKVKRYNTMLAIADQQFRGKKRLTNPMFFAAVATHHGEFSPDMIRLIELLTRQASRNFKFGHDTQGLSRQRFTSMFRTRLKDALTTGIATGYAGHICAAGTPIQGWVSAPIDARLDEPSWDNFSY